VSKDTLSQVDLADKTLKAGSGILFKFLDDKILISAENTTRIIQGSFVLEGKEIVIESGRGIKISSRHPNILVIESDLTKVEEAMYDLKKSTDDRLRVIETVFAQIIKKAKQ